MKYSKNYIPLKETKNLYSNEKYKSDRNIFREGFPRKNRNRFKKINKIVIVMVLNV
jgi:hypothetical protein